MTELEKIAYAKSFIDKLANGINPLDDTPIPEGDIANNVRLSRCFFYVSDILRQVCENGGVKKPKRTPKVPFAVTLEQRESFEYSEKPIPVSEIASRIQRMVDNENMEKVTSRQINQWLLNVGMLCLCNFGEDKTVKRPTEYGTQTGITVESRMGQYGEYKVVLYGLEAQRLILDNLEAIAATETRKRKQSDGKDYPSQA